MTLFPYTTLFRSEIVGRDYLTRPIAILPSPVPFLCSFAHFLCSFPFRPISSGVTLFDTSDIYGPFTNEILLGKALQGGMRDKVELATKFGLTFSDGKREIKGDPAYVRAACEASLNRLGIDCIDLYYQHRIDTRVPIEVTVSFFCPFNL